MELIIFALIAGVIGYAIAKSRFSKPIDSAAGAVSSGTKDVAGKAAGWWQTTLGRGKTGNEFVAWVAGSGASLFPDDFKTWVAGLSPQEAEDFTRALDKYSASLGYNLQDLVEGKLANQAMIVPVFTEAIVVYSGAYRKSRQALKEAKTAPPPAAPTAETQNTPPANDKDQAEKAPSRRKSGSESPESVAA